MKNETKLALAACCRSTIFGGFEWLAEDFGQLVTWSLEEYFHYAPIEASQFDKEVVLKEVVAASSEEIRHALEEIGFAANPVVMDGMTADWRLDGNKWMSFIEWAAEHRDE